MRLLILPVLGSLLLVAVTTPPSTPAEPFVELDAVLRPSRVVHVGSASEGLLESVLVDRGDFVQAGQLLAELDLTVERASAALAKSRAKQVAAQRAAEVKLDHVEERYENHQSLFEDGILSSENLGETQFERQLAELELLQAEEQNEIAQCEYRRARAIVDRGRITSPVAGAVIDRNLSPGEVVGRGNPSTIVTIARLDPLIVDVNAPLALLGKVGPAMKAEAIVEEPTQRSIPAKVKTVSPVVDVASGTFAVRLELPNPDFRIPAGLRCRIRFLR
jgi:RND family efflux transporter MFP subunit